MKLLLKFGFLCMDISDLTILDVRLMALKKAYADIILNTEKEVAKRIMVSDRKVVRLEYELKVAKEDAICFGLRFEKGLGLCCLGVWFRFRFWL
ncbi:hypothetical protein HanOQP8_Chr04g0140721 [Helianthus annuus]|nr:hypothetical protein HanIR_Chr04g0167811 [Helianthus annuus]KAJ0760676.1 hypothetical protein HanOQP8_Chr04g0140721 [Helianthus annuus]